MSYDLTMNVTNSVAKGTVIYEKGEPLQSVGLILKGRVVVQAEGVFTVLGSGNFLGIADVEEGKHSFTYRALDDTVIYGLPISSFEHACLLLEEKQQYRGLLVTSLNFFIMDLHKVFQRLKKEAEEVSSFVVKIYNKYQKLSSTSGLLMENIPAIERLMKGEEKDAPLPDGLEYFLQCCRVPVEAQRNFFGANTCVATEHYKGQIKVLPGLIDGCRHYGECILRYFRSMVMDEKNLFTLIGKMAMNMKKAGQRDSGLSELLDELLDKINATEKVLTEVAGLSPNLNRAKLEEVYFALLSDDTGSLEAFEKEDLGVLTGSMAQIVEYAPVHMKVASEFTEAMEEFLALTDKFARTPEATAIRRKVTKNFFELYEAVVKKSFDDPKPPLAVRLYLRYGYVSEELLTEDELRTLLTLPEIDNDQLECKVYTMPEWLRAIYTGKKNPSKDEFDMDFEAHLRQMAAEGKIAKESLAEEFRKPEQRLHFEIDKLLRYADRVISGNISAFVPVLCSEAIFNRMDKSVVTGAAINAVVQKIEKTDFSIFYRDHMTSYEEAAITQFELVDRYVPDFVLFPVYGRQGLMWQDMEGRKKTSHGRVLMPSFLETDLEQELTKLMAHFRWEKCRSEMGAQWNNYRYPSLTSEYTDYLQFYKKNSDLSPDKKEKIKAQLQQCNNRHRDVFAKDYQDWIVREASGAMRLNKIVRDIMFTYCPFANKLAESLVMQNAYQEAARRYMTAKRKTEKNIMVAQSRFDKIGEKLPEEIERTKKYLLET